MGFELGVGEKIPFKLTLAPQGSAAVKQSDVISVVSTEPDVVAVTLDDAAKAPALASGYITGVALKANAVVMAMIRDSQPGSSDRAASLMIDVVAAPGAANRGPEQAVSSAITGLILTLVVPPVNKSKVPELPKERSNG